MQLTKLDYFFKMLNNYEEAKMAILNKDYIRKEII